MPLFDYRCDECERVREVLQLGEERSPICCRVPMRKLVGLPALIRIKGTGYPSRRKWMDDWTPQSPEFKIGSLHGEKY